MNKNRLLSFLLPLIGTFSLISNQQISVRAEVNATEQIQITAQQNQTFRQFMDAGYGNLQNDNYQQALFNFNSALKLRPNDQEAIKAVNKARGYIYDYNMEKGYEATNKREYERALTYFRFASQQRPNDFYSQKAIENVQKLIEKEANKGIGDLSGQNRLVTLLIFIFFLLFIIIMALISIGWRLLQMNSDKKDRNKYPEYSERETDSLSTPPEDSILKSSHSHLSPAPMNSSETVDNISQDTPIPYTDSSDSHNSNKNRQPTINDEPQPELQSPLHKQSFNRRSVNKPEESSDGNLVRQTKEKPSIAITTDETQQLLKKLKSADRVQRGKIIWNLASQADSRAIQPLVNLMLSSNSQEKSLILEALAQIGFNSIKPINQALIFALQDQHDYVRKNALRDITKLYELMLQIRPIIAHATLNDPDHEVREIARWALTKFSQENNNDNLLGGQSQHQGYEQEINATIIEDPLN